MSDTAEWDDINVPEKVEYEVEEEKPNLENLLEELNNANEEECASCAI